MLPTWILKYTKLGKDLLTLIMDEINICMYNYFLTSHSIMF